jgi:hypothetical protein
LPNQTLIIALKERGLSAGQVAPFFTFSVIPWLISKSYLLLDLLAGRQSWAGDRPCRAAQLLVAGGPVHHHGSGAGRLNERRMRIEDAYGQLYRRHV